MRYRKGEPNECQPKSAPHPRRRGEPLHPRILRHRRALLFWLAVACFGVGAIIVIALLKELGIP